MSFENYEEQRRAIIKFIMNSTNVIEHERYMISYVDMLHEFSDLISEKSISNFKNFLMLFDLIFDHQTIGVNDYEKILNIAENTLRKSKSKNQFITYIQRNRISRSFNDIVRHIVTARDRLVDTGFSNQSYDESAKFDIFLSHRYYNKFYNFVVYIILKNLYKLNVYVDWICDAHMNRRKINRSTVKKLKNRMEQSSNLLFFNLDRTSTTNWMAWEVGYFSRQKGQIGILDLLDYATSSTNVEVLSSNNLIVVGNRGKLIVKETGKSISEWCEEAPMKY